MKKYILLIGFLIQLIGIAGLNAQDQTPATEYLLNNSTMGTDFWVAIPQNEIANSALKILSFEIDVCSPRKANVTLEIPSTGYTITKNVQALALEKFSIPATMEVTESETVVNKGIHITSDEPVFVTVLTCKEEKPFWGAAIKNGEGYTAIPVSAWGNTYFHCSYYDFHNKDQTGMWGTADLNKFRGGGFLIVASENGTSVSISLNGDGGSAATTEGGKKIGQTFSVSLNAGDTYMVKGDGKTKNTFDLTGSRIVGTNKPIGVISLHVRTMIPQTCPDGRGNMCEMLPPVNQWGKTYVNVQFPRTQKNGASGEGDLFRVVANDGGANVRCEFFDMVNNQSMGVRNATLTQGGKYASYDDPSEISNNNTKKSIRGVSLWTSDKPFMLMQYAFSQVWDNDGSWNPAMVIVPPVEQFVNTGIFNATDDNYTQTYLTLFVQGDPEGKDDSLLKHLLIDGVPLTTKVSSALANKIPGTSIYWSRLLIPSGVHTITSQSKFAGIVSGRNNGNAYTYPIGLGTNVLDKVDVKKPVITKNLKCGDYTIDATDKANGDVGLSKIVLHYEKTTNYTMQLKNPQAFKPQNGITTQTFYLNLIDKLKPAVAVFSVLDRAGNITTDSVKYEPDKLDVTTLSFKDVKLKRTAQGKIVLTNTGQSILTIQRMFFTDGKKFKVDTTKLPMDINPNSSEQVTIQYSPDINSVSTNDFDTLNVILPCISQKIEFNGNGKMPIVQVKNHDFGSNSTEVNTSKCLEELNGEGFTIRNNGNDTLTVTDLVGVAEPFMLKKPTNPAFPFKVLPGKEEYLKSICFVPSDTLEHSITVKIITDAAVGDSVATIKGKGFKVVGVDDDNAEVYLYITPNPSYNEDVNIKLASPYNVKEIVLVNNSGINEKQIFKGFLSKNDIGIYKISVKDLPSGTYYLNIITDNKPITKKLMIIK